MKEKGLTGAIAIVSLIIAAIVIVGLAANYFGKAGEALDLQIYKDTLQIQALQRSVDIGTGDSGEIGIFGYSNIKPYVNFYFEDLTGTARNPTVYMYTENPEGLSGGEYWGLERSWANNADQYWAAETASSGKVQKLIDVATKIWAHASLSGYKDVFFEYTVPERGDVEPSAAVDTNAGLTADTFITGQYDTTALATSIDLGHDATNHTNTELTKSITSNIVADNKEVCLSELRLTNFNKSVVNKVTIDINGKELLIYDESGGTNRVSYEDSTYAQVYDSDDHDTHKNYINSVCWSENQLPSILVHVWADTLDTTVPHATGYLQNGNETFKMELDDREGTALVDAVSVTA